MKTYPINDNNLNSKFEYFSKGQMLPKFEWGKKLYIEYKGALRAAIPLYSALVSNVKKTGSPIQDGVYEVVCFNIAGIGKELLKWEIYYNDGRVKASDWNPRIFLTKEDYDSFIEGKGTTYTPDGVLVRDILRVEGYSHLHETNCWYYQIIGWCWNYEEPRECPMGFKECWIDEDGGHVTVIHEGWGNPEYPAYRTREECLTANRKEVIDFDDESLVDEDQQWIVNLPKTVAVTAKTAEEAERIVKDAINKIVK